MKLFNVLLKKELVTQLFGDARGKKRDIPGAIVSVLISALFLTLFVFLFVRLQREFFSLNLENEILILFIAVAIIAQVVFIIPRAGNVLYGGADAKVVLPLPISNVIMLAAKLSALWVKEIVNSCFFLLPLLLAYGIMMSAGAAYYIGMVFAIALASLFTVSIAALLAPLFIKIKAFITRFPLPILGVSVVFFIAVFALYSRLLGIISDMLIGNRLRFIFNTKVAAGIRKVSNFMLYSKQLADMLLGNIWCIILVPVVTAGLAVGAYFLSSHFYLTFLKSNSSRKSRPAKERPNKIRSETGTLIAKEFIEIFMNPALLFSYLSVVLTLPMLCYVTLGAMDGLIANLLGGDFLLPFAILILMMFSCVCNTSAGDVISREENRIMIVKTIPVPYRKQIWVKAGIALVIAAISDLLTAILLAATKTVSLGMAAMLFVLTLFASSASILRLISGDVNNPASGKGDENPNVTFAIIRAILISCVLGGICFILNAVGTLYPGSGRSFLVAFRNIYNALGMVGLTWICIAVCFIDLALAVFKLSFKLDERMRRIKI